MNADRIKYTSEFKYRGFSEWFSIEGTVQLGETVMEAYIDAKKKVLEAYISSNPERFKNGEMVIQNDTDTEVDKLIANELQKCYAEISTSTDTVEATAIAKKYGFHLRPEMKDFITKHFKQS